MEGNTKVRERYSPLVLTGTESLPREQWLEYRRLGIGGSNNAKGRWWRDGMETVPPYYEAQGRHYMAVTDIDRVFFCCLYGNTEDETIIREIRRDAAYEEEMIFLERQFWEGHVQKKVPPPYLEDGDVIPESLYRYCGPADKGAGQGPPDPFHGRGLRHPHDGCGGTGAGGGMGGR